VWAVVDSERALTEAALSRERKRHRTIVADFVAQGKKRLHRTIWDNMLPEDRKEFVDVAAYYESHFKVPLSALSSKSFVPRALNGDARVHGLHLARRQLALYAKKVYVATHEKLDDVRAFLADIARGALSPEESKDQAEKLVKPCDDMLDSVDIRVYLAGIEYDNLWFVLLFASGRAVPSICWRVG
jgi:hypothetical protein